MLRGFPCLLVTLTLPGYAFASSPLGKISKRQPSSLLHPHPPFLLSQSRPARITSSKHEQKSFISNDTTAVEEPTPNPHPSSSHHTHSHSPFSFPLVFAVSYCSLLHTTTVGRTLRLPLAYSYQKDKSRGGWHRWQQSHAALASTFIRFGFIRLLLLVLHPLISKA